MMHLETFAALAKIPEGLTMKLLQELGCLGVIGLVEVNSNQH